MTSRARRSMDHADMRARRSPEITLDLAADELPICSRLPNYDIKYSSTARIEYCKAYHVRYLGTSDVAHARIPQAAAS